MSGARVAARLPGAKGEVVNLSLTGALVEVDAPLPVDSENTLTLSRGSLSLTFTVRILRLAPAAKRNRWEIAMVFIQSPLEARKILPSLIRGDVN